VRLSITKGQINKLIGELRRAGRREIGGVLVGEHRGGDDFALVDLSVQRRGGGRAHFHRDPVQAALFVDRAIASAGGQAERVNYVGEWHSHPSFCASPSVTDLEQMQAIVDDPDETATFAVLIVVSGRPAGLAMSATLFRSGTGMAEPVEMEIVGGVAEAGCTMVPSVPTDPGDRNEDEQRSRGAPANKESDEEWLRSRTDSTGRPWWKRWFDSGW